MTSLANKVAIITGASSGIGRAAAKLFAAAGAKLVVSARRQAELDKLVAEIENNGGIATAVVGDIKDEATARRLVETAKNRFGGLDIAFNNAGATGEMGSVPEISVAGWDETLAVNLTSAFLNARHQIPAMIERGGGSIIFTSTFVGYSIGFPGLGAYAASKAGVIGLAQVIAAEFGAQRIRANALLPGGTDADAGRSVINTPEIRTFVESLHALKHLAEPEEIARSALYLAADASSFVTGSALLVDGGISVART